MLPKFAGGKDRRQVLRENALVDKALRARFVVHPAPTKLIHLLPAAQLLDDLRTSVAIKYRLRPLRLPFEPNLVRQAVVSSPFRDMSAKGFHVIGSGREGFNVEGLVLFAGKQLVQ